MTVMTMMMSMVTMKIMMMSMMTMVTMKALAVKGLAAQNPYTNAKRREKKKKKPNDKRVRGTVTDRDGAREKSQENARDDTQGDQPQEMTQDDTRDLKRARIQICDEELDDGQLENDESRSNKGYEGVPTDKGALGEVSGDQDISKILKKEVHGYSCNLCGKRCSDLSKAKSHIEAKHYPTSTGYICSCCHQWFKTKNALSIHMSREHRNKQ